MLTSSFLDPRPSSSSSPAESTSSMSSSASTSSETCAVCGDAVNGRRYGAPACLGCIVFFRRAVINKSQYKCWKKGNCVITFASRCVCRCCRLRKCFHVGMKPEAIQRRDLLGPRKPRAIMPENEMSQSLDTTINYSPSPASSVDSDDNGESSTAPFDIDSLLHLQRDQRAQHDAYSIHHIDVNGCVLMKTYGRYHRRARANDINFVLKLGLENANEWGSRFEPYRNLSQKERNLVLSEFGFGFLLIDQGYKTAQRADDGYWLLQNDTFMHPNYFFALSEEDAMKENATQKAEFHFAFVTELVKCVSDPFKKLQIDEFECAILKTVLLLTPSFPGQVAYKDIEYLHSKCMSELMEHSAQKSPGNGPERFGEILLLISSIRCGVKAIYNQTRVSDMFHLMTFDPSVRNIFLS